MSDQTVTNARVQRPASPDQRIAELRERPPVDINHGEAILLQGLAAASLRRQRLTADRLALED